MKKILFILIIALSLFAQDKPKQTNNIKSSEIRVTGGVALIIRRDSLGNLYIVIDTARTRVIQSEK